jgi:hypothetical protein
MNIAKLGKNRELIYDEPRLLDWCAALIPNTNAESWHREGAYPIGVAHNDEIIAVMVAHGYEPCYRNVQISMAATRPNWARCSTIQELLGYLFNQLKVDRVTTLIASQNKRALRFNEGLGFVREGLCLNGCGDDDRVILGLYRSAAIAKGWIDE